MEPMPVGPGGGAELEPPEPGFDAVSEAGVVGLTGALVAPLLVRGGVDASVTVRAGAVAE